MTYEYACEACGHQWEAEQSIKDAPLKSCVSCSEPKAKRLIPGGTGFLLKGGGWYADGYGSKAAAPPSASAGEAPAAKSSSEGAGGGADSGTKSEGTAKNEPKSPSPSESTASKPADASPKPSSAPSTPSAKAS